MYIINCSLTQHTYIHRWPQYKLNTTTPVFCSWDEIFTNFGGIHENAIMNFHHIADYEILE